MSACFRISHADRVVNYSFAVVRPSASQWPTLQSESACSQSSIVNATMCWLDRLQQGAGGRSVCNWRLTAALTQWWPHWNRKATDHRTVIRWLLHWPLMGGLLHWYSEDGPGRGCSPAQSPRPVPRRCTKRNSPLINGQSVYQLHINICGTIIASKF